MNRESRRTRSDLYQRWMTGFTRIAAVLTARFILDLRLVFRKSDTTNHLSSIRFASFLMANIEAPIGVEDSTWVSGAADDIASDRSNHREEVDEPFLAGLDLHHPSDSETQVEHGSTV